MRKQCYFCHQTSIQAATYADICLWHQLLLSFRLLFQAFQSGGLTWRTGWSLVWHLFLSDVFKTIARWW